MLCFFIIIHDRTFLGKQITEWHSLIRHWKRIPTQLFFYKGSFLLCFPLLSLPPSSNLHIYSYHTLLLCNTFWMCSCNENNWYNKLLLVYSLFFIQSLYLCSLFLLLVDSLWKKRAFFPSLFVVVVVRNETILCVSFTFLLPFENKTKQLQNQSLLSVSGNFTFPLLFSFVFLLRCGEMVGCGDLTYIFEMWVNLYPSPTTRGRNNYLKLTVTWNLWFLFLSINVLAFMNQYSLENLTYSPFLFFFFYIQFSIALYSPVLLPCQTFFFFFFITATSFSSSSPSLILLAPHTYTFSTSFDNLEI